jgi:hypothetical protein
MPVFLQLLCVLHHQVQGHVPAPEHGQDVCFGLHGQHVKGHQVQRQGGIHKFSWAWPSGHFDMARLMQVECQLMEALSIQFDGLVGFSDVFPTILPLSRQKNAASIFKRISTCQQAASLK